MIKKISKLIVKKSSSHLKIATTLFALSLILISVVSILFIRQYIQIDKDFVKNNNTHIIEISSINNESSIDKLKFNDIDKIKSTLKDSDCKVFTEYQLSFGLEGNDGKIYYLYGIDNEAIELLGKQASDNILYFTNDKEHTSENIINLSVPLIDIQNGGFSSNDSIEYEMGVCLIDDDIPFELHDTLKKFYITTSTYQKFIEIMFSTTWDDFKTKYDLNNPFGLTALNKIYVYVNDIGKIEFTANILETMGYNLNYTFKSFDNFDASIKLTLLVSIIFIVAFIIFSVMHMIFAFNSYLKVQQKDMGILKQYGYANKQVVDIYKSNIKSIFIKVTTFSTLLVVILFSVFLETSYIFYIIYPIFIIIVLSFLIYWIVINIIVKRYVKKDIISLVKTSKEFE